MERPEARGDGDWAVVGDIPGSKFSIILWYTRLQQFLGRRPNRRGPMFLDPDMQRPLVYRKLLKQFKDLQRRVGVPEDELTGPHGLRVEGFNGTKGGLGEELAQVQGGWKSTAFKRYDRFRMEQVVRIPGVIVGEDEGDDPAATNEAEERPAGPPARRLRRRDVQPARAGALAAVRRAYGSDGDDEEDDADEEPGGSDADDESERAQSAPASGYSDDPDDEAPLLSLTPGGATARPGGAYWGTPSRRPAPGMRSGSRRGEPSSSRD